MPTALPLRFGALHDAATGETAFRLWAPSQQQVVLETDDGRAFPMNVGADGWFDATLPLPAGSGYRYRVTHEGQSMAIADPASRAQRGDVHDLSVVVDPNAYPWQQAHWRGRPWHEAVVYELHAGLMGGFAGIEARLPELAALGVTVIELMPIADFPGSRNWGYDGVLPYAPDAAYGTPDELRRLIDTAHALGLSVMLDVVYNHFGPDGNFLPLLAPAFYRTGSHTPWGAAIDFSRPEVRAFFTGNAIHWICDYRFDGLRLDAVHAIGDPAWLDEMALAVRQAAGPQRHVHLVLENEDNSADRLIPERNRFDAQWNDDAHHALHVLLTGESEGYYRDFADAPAEHLARVLAEGFAFQGQPSQNWDGEARGTPSGHLPPTAFVDCLQNHDQIGNRAFGDRLIALAEPEGLRAAVTLLLLSPHIPLIFMGEEDGSATPFIFFTSHHDELANQVREGRRNEFAHFAVFADPVLRERIPDPNAEQTFESSRPRPGPERDLWRQLYQRLLAIRRERLMPHLGNVCSRGARALDRASVVAEWRLGDGSRLVIGSNFGAAAVRWADVPAEQHLVFSSGPSEGEAIAGRCTRVYIVTEQREPAGD